MKRSRSEYSPPRSRSPSPSPDARSHAALRVPVTPTKAAAMKEFASPLRRRQSSSGAAAAAAASSMLPPPPSPLKTGGQHQEQQQQQQQQQQRVPLSRLQEAARPNGDAHQSATKTSFQSPSKRSSLSRGPRTRTAGPSASDSGATGLAISSPPRVVTAGGAMRVLTPAKVARNAGGNRRHVSGEGDSTLSYSNSSKENDLPSSATHLPSDGSGGGETAAVSGGGGGKSDGFGVSNRFGAARRVSSHSSGSGDRPVDDEEGSSDDDDDDDDDGDDGVLPGRVAVAPVRTAAAAAAAAAAARSAFGPARVNAGHCSSAVAATAADRRASAASSRRVRRVGNGRDGTGASVGTEAGEPHRSAARRSSSSAKSAGPGVSEAAVSSWGTVGAAADIRNDPRRVSTWSNNSSSSSAPSIGGEEHAGRRSVSRRIGTRHRNSSTGGSSSSAASEDASAVLSSASNASSAKRNLTGAAAGRVRDRSTSSGGGGEGLARRASAAGRYLAGTCEECGKGKGEKRGGEGGRPLCEDCAVDSAENEAERQRVGARRPAGRRSGVAAAPVRRRSVVPPAATEAAGGDGGGNGGAVEDLDLRRRMCIQDFQVTSKLGMGKFGIVYKAKSKQSHKTVAIKVIYKSSLRDGNYQDAVNLDRERRLQANLRHPNIVGIQDSFQDPKFVYLVLDFASGGDVYKVLSQERHKMGLPHEVAAAYLYDAASAVDYLHRMHVMHRDLKAENLLVDSRGRLQLSDFGWAVHAKPPHQHIRRTMCGTPEYAPPEILVRHPEYTKAVDIWSLGVLAFELLTGKTPFSRAHPATSPRTAADCNTDDGSSTQTSHSPNGGSGPTTTGMQRAPGGAEAAAAAEVEEIHKGDDHAKLYGRIAGWGGSRDSLFGRGARGSGAPELARDVVMAMLRPVPGDRLEAGEVLKLPWVALRGKGAAASATT